MQHSHGSGLRPTVARGARDQRVGGFERVPHARNHRSSSPRNQRVGPEAPVPTRRISLRPRLLMRPIPHVPSPRVEPMRHLFRSGLLRGPRDRHVDPGRRVRPEPPGARRAESHILHSDRRRHAFIRVTPAVPG